MGIEIIYVFLPFIFVHMCYVIFKACGENYRVHALVLSSGLAAVFAVLLFNFTREVSTFFAFFSFMYVVIVFPIAFLLFLVNAFKKIFSQST